MRLFGRFIAFSAALALIGGLGMGAAQAAPAAGKVVVSSQLDLIAAKKKKTKKKSAKKGGPGTCGVMNYWDKKTKKCASAMTKKV